MGWDGETLQKDLPGSLAGSPVAWRRQFWLSLYLSVFPSSRELLPFTVSLDFVGGRGGLVFIDGALVPREAGDFQGDPQVCLWGRVLGSENPVFTPVQASNRGLLSLRPEVVESAGRPACCLGFQGDLLDESGGLALLALSSSCVSTPTRPVPVP